MYAKRNSLTILVLLVMISSIGFFWYRSEGKNLTQVSAKNKELMMKLRGALEVAETLQKVTTERDTLLRNWESSPKKILNTEEPAFSLSYINWLIRLHNLDLDFDFYLNDKKARKEFTTFSYTLNGEGDYRNICTLIWYITKNPLLYQIKSVNLKRAGDPKLVSFAVMFEGYSMNKEWEVGNELAMASPSFNWGTELYHDAFASLLPALPAPVVEAKPVQAVAAPPPKPKEPPGLLDVEKATLLAITNNQAYLRAQDGKIVTLGAGSRVRTGRLVRIDQQRNQVEFELETESGGTRSVRLNIEYN